MDVQENQIKRRLMGVMGLNPFDNTNSASRKQMFSSHISQNLVIQSPSIKKIQTGMEMEYGKYTFAKTMPENGRILKVFTRYPENDYVADGFKLSPEMIAIYESEDGAIGMIQLEKIFTMHPQFGFEYKKGKALDKLIPNNFIGKNEVFYDSPSKGKNGEYNFGTELNIAFMSHPCVSEDGIGISKDVLPKLRFKVYEKRVVEWGRDRYPLNLYGDDDNYKVFPEIGDYVHPNDEHKGLLMALREYDPGLLAIDQSKRALQKLDPIFDKATYVSGEGGRVVDIKVYHQPLAKGETICDEMMKQPIRYKDALMEFRNKILNEYFALKRQRGSHLKLTPEFHRYIVETMAIVNQNVESVKTNLQLTYKNVPINEWRAEFLIEYDILPDIGNKATDFFGGKGVITHIFDPDQMPVAKNGLRADIVMDPAATVNRMNFGRKYEQYLNSVKYDLELELRSLLNVDLSDPIAITKGKIANSENNVLNRALERLNHYHDIVSPKQGQWMRNLPMDKKINYLGDCLTECIIDYHPTETNHELMDMVSELEKHFPSTFDVVTFKDEHGNLRQSKEKIRIGSIYMMLLEKIGYDWSSVSTAKTQQNGIISYTASKDKHATPTKQQATRVLGESEIRVLAAYVGGDFAVELHDRSNNSQARKEIVKNILQAKKPTNIECVVDRMGIPLGHSKPLQLVNHYMHSAGFELMYQPFDPSTQSPAKEDIFVGKDD